MPFGRHPLAGHDHRHLRTDLLDNTHEFVSYHHRDRDRALGPVVPVHDVAIGSTDRDLSDLNEDIVWTWARTLDIFEPYSGLGARFHQRLHVTTPNSRPTSTNAEIA